MKGFKIAARNNGNVVIDVTSFFGTNEAYISPLKEVSVFLNSSAMPMPSRVLSLPMLPASTS